MNQRNQRDRKTREIVDLLIPWGLAFLALLTALGAIVRMFLATDAKILDRIDNTTLLYLVVAGALLLLRQIKTLSFGDVKLEMLEKVKARQAQQEEKLDDIDIILPLLLPNEERKHLINLAEGKTQYQGNKSLRDELRRLRKIRLISTRMGYIADIKDGMKFDLADRIELTTLGKRWASRLRELENKED